MKLSIVIVNYNVSYFLEQTLLSVRNALQGIDAEVFVVDNNSVDRSVDMVKAKFPEVKLIANTVNYGFSKANNQAIKIAAGEYVLLLNPDTVLEENTLRLCVDFMDKTPDAGGLGVKMVDGKGVFLPESKRGLPTPWVAFTKMSGLAALFPKSKLFGHYHLGYLPTDQINEVEVLSGAFMLLRKSVLDKIGLLDEDYFMYGEDIDLSYRITKGGFKNYYFPDTRIIHYKGESTKKTSVNYVVVFYKAMKIFAQKHFSPNNAGMFSLLINFAILFRASIAIAYRFASQMALALLDFVIAYLGLIFIKNYWEANHKYVGIYPDYFLYGIIPAYIVIWLLSAYFNGAYHKPFKVFATVRGIVLGTLFIAAVSNFYDPIRFSKAIILLGAGWTIFAVVFVRYALHYYRYRNFSPEGTTNKRLLMVGSEAEAQRALALLKESKVTYDYVGFVNSTTAASTSEHCLGSMQHLPDIVRIFAVEEVIFCGKDISVQDTISYMSSYADMRVEYKIFPDNSNFIIGSNSKNSQGDFYTINVNYAILSANNIRAKRVLDIFMSMLLLTLSPLLMWLCKKPLGYIGNCLQVLAGNYSLVGFSNASAMNLAQVKKGILSPLSGLPGKEAIDTMNRDRLDRLYAKDYTPETDISIIVRGFRELGNSTE